MSACVPPPVGGITILRPFKLNIARGIKNRVLVSSLRITFSMYDFSFVTERIDGFAVSLTSMGKRKNNDVAGRHVAGMGQSTNFYYCTSHSASYGLISIQRREPARQVNRQSHQRALTDTSCYNESTWIEERSEDQTVKPKPSDRMKGIRVRKHCDHYPRGIV